jgi:hypothetical protein
MRHFKLRFMTARRPSVCSCCLSEIRIGDRIGSDGFHDWHGRCSKVKGRMLDSNRNERFVKVDDVKADLALLAQVA